MAVTVQAQFTKETKEFDGLGAISDELVAHPNQRVFVVAEIEVTDININIKGGGVKTPKVRWTSVEVMTGDDLLTAQKLRDAAYHERTGQTAPPPTLFDDTPPPDGLGEDAARVADEADAARGNPAFVEPGPDAAGLWPGDDGYVAPAPAPPVADDLAGKRARRR